MHCWTCGHSDKTKISVMLLLVLLLSLRQADFFYLLKVHISRALPYSRRGTFLGSIYLGSPSGIEPAPSSTWVNHFTVWATVNGISSTYNCKLIRFCLCTTTFLFCWKRTFSHPVAKKKYPFQTCSCCLVIYLLFFRKFSIYNQQGNLITS